MIVTIDVRVKLKAAKPKVVKIDDSHFEVSIHSAPEKGKANEELLRLLADYFDVSLSSIDIVSGLQSRSKKVVVRTLRED